MSPTSTALVARARGLATHLFSRSVLISALEAPDLDALTRRLEERGMPLVSRPVTVAELELAARRWAARELARLARWVPGDTALAEAIFGDEDRRSVRAMIRGAASGAPPEKRLAGLIPTPRLPERLLGELARQSSAAHVASLLVAWGHPLGSPLLEATGGTEPDLAAVERALLRGAVDALRARAMRWGSGLRTWTREAIDLANARTVVGIAARDDEPQLEHVLLEGGGIPVAAFGPAVASESRADAARLVADLLPPGPLAAAFRDHASSLSLLDDALLAARVGAHRHAVRLDPLGPEPVLLYALRLRAQVMLIRQAIWRLSLGIPLPALNPLLEAAS
jgi:vacuolar-type H+-ATPase subunit C/Vma6